MRGTTVALFYGLFPSFLRTLLWPADWSRIQKYSPESQSAPKTILSENRAYSVQYGLYDVLYEYLLDKTNHNNYYY